MGSALAFAMTRTVEQLSAEQGNSEKAGGRLAPSGRSKIDLKSSLGLFLPIAPLACFVRATARQPALAHTAITFATITSPFQPL